MVQWFCLIAWRLFDIWTPYFGIMSQYDLEIFVGHWPIFHGSVILPCSLKTNWYMNTILWYYESVWPDAWPQNICMTLWPIFHGPVILPSILNTIQWLNIKFLEYESVWPNFWPQNKCRSLWLYFMVQWFCLIAWRLFHVWMSLLGIMNQYDPTIDLKINVDHCDLYFMGQWLCLIA